MDPAVMEFVKWLLEVVVAALTVLGILWRSIDNMISKKVKSQVEAAMAKITETTSGAISDLEREIRENHREQLERTDDRFDKLTARIDRLLGN